MPRPSFTWTVVLPHHLIQSVCDLCTRTIGVSSRGELLHIMEALHHCAAARKPMQSVAFAPVRSSRPKLQ